MNLINQTYWVWDVEDQEISCDKSFLNQFELTESVFLTPLHFWESLIDPEHYTLFLKEIKDLLRNPDKSSFSIQTALKCQAGEFSSAEISGELHNPKRIAGEIKLHSQKPFEDDSYLMKLLMDHLPHSIFFKDQQSRFLRINKTCSGKFGLNHPGEAIGKTDFDIFEDEHAQSALDDEKEILKTGEPIIDKEEKEVFSDDKSVRWTSTSKFPMYNSEGEIIGTFGITKDITENKNQQDELRETIDIISHQNSRFQNFAHIVSHNLRNHAGNITMILSLIEEADSDQELEDFMGYLATASDRLNETIQDLNNIVDAQYNTNLEFKPLNLYKNLQNVKDILSSEIMIHNVKFKESIPEDLEIEYNPAYLESILLNLISNAIKYSHPDRKPEVEISASQNGEDTILTVSDNGIGLDLKKHSDELFGMYKTFHSNKNSKGIGLYITKNQVESLGGRIEVDSEPGKGSSFTIHFGS
ncbi:PAS domain-containing sensor histidine kinase [Rhodohalobacter sp.]|uniref:sensor histidine kinase n=1 Tax=Rhodohalobacter sp. TaxID=1974210 RepID=UPI002ACE1CF3|nr:PAS domain-containing sensor histidine kinase [Rhodohalobacter sp.]MDZ7754873.1 PAS domain-containing sensor histidine kinase [Rhodohalobacter sp.]